MTFEEFENATDVELRRAAKEDFDGAQGATWPVKVPLLLRAQFHMVEMDRRHEAKIVRRDFRLELIIIGLIGLEIIIGLAGIWLGFREANDQARILERQAGILRRLQDSSAATAGTLTAMQSTSEAMNAAVQAQLNLTYRVSVIVTYEPGMKSVFVINTGNTTISLHATKTDALPVVPEKLVKFIPPGTQYYFSGLQVDGEFTKRLGKNPTATLAFELYMKGSDGQRYVVKCSFIGSHDQKGNLQVKSEVLSTTKLP